MLQTVKNIAKLSIQYACVTHCIFEYIADFVVCSGPSMQPTLFTNNILFTERITLNYSVPKRGDIIIAVSPTNADQYICKRVIGVPGDKIIKKATSNEEYKIEKNTNEYVPRGHIWIEGDNRENSSDSRSYGPIPLGLVKSRVLLRLWPLNEMKLL
ncbi:mitochondrial inner membrane protease subunit 1 [Teleopsis dalmanni]|uniref:mitochondrial inner membrane protease subunit 1 n=1 Tax=Teleopsis dalmanni TaxID=139649 RepID=UPI0018CEBD28|nr:mitochondrial inner membrane protease subunit 1 [Teleopsis dalmanni]